MNAPVGALQETHSRCGCGYRTDTVSSNHKPNGKVHTMSVDLTITATVITQSGTDLTPVGVQIRGTGNMPTGALRAVAVEALEVFTGSVQAHHGFKVEAEPSFHEQTDDTVTIFPVFKSLAVK